MAEITIHGLDDEVMKRLQRFAEEDGVSIQTIGRNLLMGAMQWREDLPELDRKAAEGRAEYEVAKAARPVLDPELRKRMKEAPQRAKENEAKYKELAKKYEEMCQTGEELRQKLDRLSAEQRSGLSDQKQISE